MIFFAKNLSATGYCATSDGRITKTKDLITIASDRVLQRVTRRIANGVWNVRASKHAKI